MKQWRERLRDCGEVGVVMEKQGFTDTAQSYQGSQREVKSVWSFLAKFASHCPYTVLTISMDFKKDFTHFTKPLYPSHTKAYRGEGI
ncbi:hypothetical protein RI534_08340 [Aeromonas allosaccharophila]|uniref:hypothetical protein n=1 Tax=Aeromonas allosaccharophila TaxID=656 RepID=UPI0034268368